MNLNATLLVQGIHFLIAYGTIRFLFLKPVLRELNQEKQELDGLESVLTGNKEAYEKERMIAHTIAHEQHAYFAAHTPQHPQDANEYCHVPTIELAMPSEEQEARCVRSLRDTILKHVQEGQ